MEQQPCRAQGVFLTRVTVLAIPELSQILVVLQ